MTIDISRSKPEFKPIRASAYARESAGGAACPNCGARHVAVINSRPVMTEDGVETIRRRRACRSCDMRFTTFEVSEPWMTALVEEVRRARDEAASLEKAMTVLLRGRS